MVGVVRRVHELDGTRPDPLDPVVALTFDDGPGPSTAPVLDALAATGTPATFFVLGANADADPTMVARTAADGHTIGTHTWSHSRPDELGDEGIVAETLRANALVEELTGRPVRLMRPPYRTSYAPQCAAALAPFGLTTVIWSVDPRDWDHDDPDDIVEGVLTHLHPGAIVVLHDGGRERPATVAALPGVVAGATALGYRFVAL
ncbi:MAG: polysaccharide deacetylase family protein [Acidimicrobiales bacterium]|jgi:peptidoglycan/xylan/chitin deacetylase (PgdA/CDA1 family)|nr:polysaccharide deacetylase family protein [Acidimicrobiales bacterium]